ncbi:MAG TPA: nuclear transport factor 2 family protein [Candidatus Nitrosotalea sp.]|nr:nuclear transport factor 2 family protein [Candidatus Nitrosotalea sp.]
MSKPAERPSLAVDLLKRLYSAGPYAGGDLDTIRNEVLAPDVVWTIPGRHPLAGPKHGVDEILAYFLEASKSNIKVDVLFMAGDDTQVVEVHRGWGKTDKASMDQLFVLYGRVKNGRLAEVTAFAADQDQIDDFFCANYSLAPIPDRLARQ